MPEPLGATDADWAQRSTAELVPLGASTCNPEVSLTPPGLRPIIVRAYWSGTGPVLVRKVPPKVLKVLKVLMPSG